MKFYDKERSVKIMKFGAILILISYILEGITKLF